MYKTLPPWKWWDTLGIHDKDVCVKSLPRWYKICEHRNRCMLKADLKGPIQKRSTLQMFCGFSAAFDPFGPQTIPALRYLQLIKFGVQFSHSDVAVTSSKCTAVDPDPPVLCSVGLDYETGETVPGRNWWVGGSTAEPTASP